MQVHGSAIGNSIEKFPDKLAVKLTDHRGGKITFKFKVKVNDDVNGQRIDNVAKVNNGKNEYITNETHNPTNPEPKKEVYTGSTTTNIDGQEVKAGQELTYAITYQNTTGEDRDVTVTDKERTSAA